ncbi:hypothetical protein AzCIB_3931 [Azoarcus sp. CIB]|uniref:hypothetical protein n=1 Tax=Aromatoleum sp. (strain CIB) TaxID=198107 RepID=UPI00067AE85D|nr:hypothetical protein [Azoarcus sp. CIB]AKU13824.1 hypothetical protein AzCIB_3931 [Azoarcus sp. CIB]
MIRLVRACFLVFSLLAAPSALAQIVIVAGARSPLPELTLEQAEQFYLGRAHTLPDGSGLTLADLPPGQIRDQFYQQLTRKNANQIRAHWSRMVFTGRALPPQQAESVAQLRLWLASQPNLIGYMPAADADGRVKVLLRLP